MTWVTGFSSATELGPHIWMFDILILQQQDIQGAVPGPNNSDTLIWQHAHPILNPAIKVAFLQVSVFAGNLQVECMPTWKFGG